MLASSGDITEPCPVPTSLTVTTPSSRTPDHRTDSIRALPCPWHLARSLPGNFGVVPGLLDKEYQRWAWPSLLTRQVRACQSRKSPALLPAQEHLLSS